MIPSDETSLHLKPSPVKETELAKRMGISRAAIAVKMSAAGPMVLPLIDPQEICYALRRPTRWGFEPLPIFEIDSDGLAKEIALLDLLTNDRGCVTWCSTPNWPVETPGPYTFFSDLPYYLRNLWPRGYLGRAFSRTHAQSLNLPALPDQWTLEQMLYAMSIHGADVPGNLIIGREALSRFQSKARNEAPISSENRARAYSQLAYQVTSGGGVESIAGGESLKFSAILERHNGLSSVLVKFTNPDQSPKSQRWSDLLVCEHIASETLRNMFSRPAAPTRILRTGGRTFLEVERFDRAGISGRRATLSLDAIYSGWPKTESRNWLEGAEKLLKAELINTDTHSAMQKLWIFGHLIGNCDMSNENLSFFPCRYRFELLPVYDMLPMAYAPSDGADLLPLKPSLHFFRSTIWRLLGPACEAALCFWDEASNDERISPEFRKISAMNVKRLMEFRRKI
jgi:hypothetical protein